MSAFLSEFGNREMYRISLDAGSSGKYSRVSFSVARKGMNAVDKPSLITVFFTGAETPFRSLADFPLVFQVAGFATIVPSVPKFGFVAMTVAIVATERLIV